MKMMTRTLWLTATAAAVTFPAAAQQRNADPDVTVAGASALPAGWAARTDRGQPVSNIKFSKMGDGWHVTLGPSSIIYQDANTASGNYHVVANFTQTKKPAGMGHPEGYGLIIGGKDLQTPNPVYTYFLVRMDGQFIIKQFTGAGTQPAFITETWVPNEAVKKADDTGKQTNELAIGISGGKASFTVNGKEVYSTDASKISTNGIVGFRVNHNLDIHVAGFAVHKM
jgi:hypothetical protein